MKKVLLFFISLVIGTLLLLAVVQKTGWEEVKSVFLSFSGWDGLIILGLSFLMLVVGNLRWQEVLKGQGINIPFLPLFRIYLAGFSVMFLAPVVLFGGETLKAYLIKKKYSLSWDQGVASVVVDRMIELTVYVFFILIGVVYFVFSTGFHFSGFNLALGSVLALFIAGIFLFYSKCFKKQSILKFFVGLFKPEADDGKPFELEMEFFKILKPTGRLFWKVVALSFLRCGVMLARVWVLLFFLGKTLGLLPALSVLSFSYFALMVPVPTALGVHETFQALVFSVLGIGSFMAPAFAMIIRAGDLLMSLIGLVLLFHFGFSLAKDVLFKKIEAFANYSNGKNHKNGQV